MDLHLKLWLLLASSALTIADLNVNSYVPQLTLRSMSGKVTATTFVLEQPQCVLTQYGSNNVWLIVANSAATSQITDLTTLVPYSSFATKGYYFTLKTIGTDYQCPSTDNSIISTIRVGADSVCTDTYCNGPLPNPGPYRVKYVVLNGNILVGQSQWSGLITLRAGRSPDTIDIWPGKRSGGMIVITSILSLLLAILLACLVAAFLSAKENLCGKKTPDTTQRLVIPEAIDMKNYKTHHVYAETEESALAKKV
ncbi:uroplakin-3b-like [Discoglossus pictus]